MKADDLIADLGIICELANRRCVVTRLTREKRRKLSRLTPG